MRDQREMSTSELASSSAACPLPDRHFLHGYISSHPSQPERFRYRFYYAALVYNWLQLHGRVQGPPGLQLIFFVDSAERGTVGTCQTKKVEYHALD